MSKEYVKVVCIVCHGTGIVREWVNDNCAIGFECPYCNGTGYMSFEPFHERKQIHGIREVFAPLSTGARIALARNPTPYSEYGVSYEDWLSGQSPSEKLREVFYETHDPEGHELKKKNKRKKKA